jgi:hypothetical protein
MDTSTASSTMSHPTPKSTPLTVTPQLTLQPARGDSQLALWLGLSLGTGVVGCFLTAYCCWQRQLRAKRILYLQLHSYSSDVGI